MRRLGLSLGLLVLWAGIAQAQITPTNTFGPSTTVTISRLNANFTDGLGAALNRTGGTITGNITVSSSVTIDGIDIGATICTTCSPTLASLTLTGGLTAGSGSVAIIGSTGKIPAISSTYFTSLSGASLTDVPTTVSENVTAAANTTGGEDNLQAGSIPANTLAAAGDSVRISAMVDLAANGNSKQVRLYIGAVAICDTGAQTTQGKVWIEALVTRYSADSIYTVCNTYGVTETSAAAFDFTQGLASGASSLTFSGALAVKTTGDGVAAADITSQVLIIQAVK